MRGHRHTREVISVPNEIQNPYHEERKDPTPGWTYDARTLPMLAVQQTQQLAALNPPQPIELLAIPWQQGMPVEADGLMPIPSITDLAQVFLGRGDGLGEGYSFILEALVSSPSQSRLFNGRKGTLTCDRLRLHADVKAGWEALEARYPARPGSIRVFQWPVNMGAFYQGFSSRNSRIDALLTQRRLPLGPVENICLLAAWPQRLEKPKQTGIDCAGAEYRPFEGKK